MKYHIFIFGTPKILKKNEIVLRQARKVVGPKAPGAHRAHGPRPLGPIQPIRSHAVAWVRDRPSAFFGSWPWPLALDHHDQDDDDYVVTT